ncbi:MAG: hypothetical protein HY097_05100 [Nitrospinae bacterium]|nr:hypothetical protein [Nitrospinota bacterium]MBI3814599.1 hypothetical protein [Nitrospinota bacterium]
MFNPEKIIEVLNNYKVEYTVIGGMAASLHGCPEQTYDMDILYNNTEDNKDRLLNALHEINARWDTPLNTMMLDSQYVFALITDYGYLDIFSYVVGIGYYNDAVKYKEISKYSDAEIEILNLEGWIKSKEAVIEEERSPRKLSAFEYMKDLYEFKKEKDIEKKFDEPELKL